MDIEIVMNIENSKKLFSDAKKNIPGGVNSPVRAFKSVGGTPLFIEKGRGAHFFDEDGNEYVDYCMSWGPLILGHADPDVTSEILCTALKGTSFGTPNRYEVELASLVTESFKSIDKVRFVNSGTEATMSAIRLARGFTKREKIIKFDGCYHGHGDYLLVAAGSGLATLGTPDSAGVTKGNAADTLVAPYNDIDSVRNAVEKFKDEIAAIILEPVACNYGLIIPELNFLKELRTLCTKNNIILIFDEVITGFRLAPGGAQEFFDIDADLTTLGKIIGGGLPVGAYGGRSDIMDFVAPDGPVYQAGTLSGNPLAMSAGVAVLKKVLEKDFHNKLDEKGKYFFEKLQPSLKKYEGKILYQGIASIFSFVFTNAKKISSLDDIKNSDLDKFAAFHGELLKRGVYFSPSAYEVGFLSSSHTKEDLDFTAKVIADVLDIIF